MYSQAKLEKDEEQVKQEIKNATAYNIPTPNLTQKKVYNKP